jgi:hypothetical protein
MNDFYRKGMKHRVGKLIQKILLQNSKPLSSKELFEKILINQNQKRINQKNLKQLKNAIKNSLPELVKSSNVFKINIDTNRVAFSIKNLDNYHLEDGERNLLFGKYQQEMNRLGTELTLKIGAVDKMASAIENFLHLPSEQNDLTQTIEKENKQIEKILSEKIGLAKIINILNQHR